MLFLREGARSIVDALKVPRSTRPVDYNKMIAEVSSKSESRILRCSETQEDPGLTSQSQIISRHVENLAYLQISAGHMNLSSGISPSLRTVQLSQDGNVMSSDYLSMLENFQEINLPAHDAQGQKENSPQTCH